MQSKSQLYFVNICYSWPLLLFYFYYWRSRSLETALVVSVLFRITVNINRLCELLILSVWLDWRRMLYVSQRVLDDFAKTRLSRRRIIWLLSHPLPHSAFDSRLDRRQIARLKKRDNLLTRGGRRRPRGGAKSYDGEKAWSSINHSILSGCYGGNC
jgi:hypothetical protein